MNIAGIWYASISMKVTNNKKFAIVFNGGAEKIIFQINLCKIFERLEIFRILIYLPFDELLHWIDQSADHCYIKARAAV